MGIPIHILFQGVWEFFVWGFFWCGLFLVVVALEANKEIASVVAGMQQFFTEKICKAY